MTGGQHITGAQRDSAAGPDCIQCTVLYGPNRLADTSTVIVSATRPSPAAGDPGLLEALLGNFGIIADREQLAEAGRWTGQVAAILSAVIDACAVPELTVKVAEPDRAIALIGDDFAAARLCADAALLFWRQGRLSGALATTELANQWEWLKQRLRQGVPDIQAQSIARACRDLGIPHHRFSARPAYHHIGEGRHRMLVDLTDTSTTSRFAVTLAGDKVATNRILGANGIPVARQELAATAAQAWQLARAIGLPVVIKPQDANQSRGVTLLVRTEAQAVAGFAAARAVSGGVIVESYIPGIDHRIIVAGDRLIGALEIPRPSVVGDGINSIVALVERHNARIAHLAPMVYPVKLDDISARLLADEGMSFDGIPEAGKRVFLHVKSGRRLGAPPIDIASRVHPDNAAMLVRATRLIGLDNSGIDFRTTNIARSWREVGGGICEVNSRAGISAFLAAKPSWVGDVFVPALVGGSVRHMIHILVVGGDADGAALDSYARLLGQLLGAERRWRCALALTVGLDLDGYQASTHAMPLLLAHRRAVENPLLDAAIYCCSPAHVEQHGFGLDRADLAIFPPTAGGLAPSERRMLQGFIDRSGARLLEQPGECDPGAVARALVELRGSR